MAQPPARAGDVTASEHSLQRLVRGSGDWELPVVGDDFREDLETVAVYWANKWLNEIPENRPASLSVDVTGCDALMHRLKSFGIPVTTAFRKGTGNKDVSGNKLDPQY